MKNIFLLLAATLVLYSCQTRKKAQVIQKAIDAKDTSKPVVINHTTTNIVTIDSNKVINDLFRKVANRKIDFNTFNAKVKVEYIGKDESQNATAYISILKNKTIYIKLKASILGILVFEAKITKDSVFLVNLYGDKYVQKRTINYLQDITQIPFDYNTLEDFIVGNPVFVDNNKISSLRYTNNNQITISSINQIFKHLISFGKDDLLISHIKLDDLDPNRNRTCDITYGGYTLVNNYQFPQTRSVSVAEKSKLDVNLEFKDVNINEPLKYSFDIPAKYKLK